MARVGMGEPFVILNPGEAEEKAARFFDYISSPVLTGVDVTFDGFRAYDVEPASVPDLFALRPLVLFGKYKGSPRGSIIVRGSTADGLFEEEIKVRKGTLSEDNSALRLLWARHRIMMLDDLNNLRHDDERVEVVTELGLEYSLMTKYTSFVAVDKIKRSDGKVITVKQSLPLPQGVSDYAVGDKKGQLTHGFASQPRMAPMPARELMKTEEPADISTVDADEVKESEMFPMNVKIIRVTGDFTDHAMEKAVTPLLLAHLRDCFMRKYLTSKTFPELTYLIHLDSKGRIVKVKLLGSSPSSPRIEQCMEKKLGSFVFPKPTTGKAVLELKFAFK
jgi:Ca-activated chloride channel family protein